MTRLMRYPATIVNLQQDTTPYRVMWDVQNIHEQDDSVGHWGAENPGSNYQNAIAGRNGYKNHPATIQCSDFLQIGASIQDNARIRGIIVQYCYRKMAYSGSGHGSFGNPTVSIPKLGLKGTGNAPPRDDFVEYNVYFGNLDFRGSDINKSDFAVLFDLPQNTSDNACYIEMKYLRIYIDYDVPNYVPQIELSQNTFEYGDTATVTVSLNETNGIVASEQIIAKVDIPSVFEVIDYPANFNISGEWTPISSNYTSKMQFQVRMKDRTASGMYTFKVTECQTMAWGGAKDSETVFVVRKEVEVLEFSVSSHELEKTLNGNKKLTYLTITLKNPARTPLELDLDLDGMQVHEDADSAVGSWNEYNRETKKLLIAYWDGNDIYDVNVPLYSTQTRDSQIVLSSSTSDEFLGVYYANVSIVEPQSSQEYYTQLLLSDFAVNSMIHGERYRFGCLIRYTGSNTMIKGLKNLRASIINNGEIFTAKVSQIGDWECVTCIFTYDSTKPVYLRFYGNYVEDDEGTVEFGDLFIIHNADFGGYEYPTLAFEDPTLLINDKNFTSLLLEPPENNPSTKHYFSGFDWMGIDKNESLIVHGIEVTGEVVTDEKINLLMLFGTSQMDESEYFIDSMYLDSASTTFKFGGLFKTFDISFNDINKLLNELKFSFQIDSVDNKTQNEVLMRNVRINLYYTINSDCWEFFINGVSSKHYLLSLEEDTEIPRGVNYDANTFKVDGADGEFPNRVNIQDKKLKLKFSTCDCGDIEDMTQVLKKVVEWIYPRRDRLDNPELNSISFFLDKSVCYDYYIEDEMDTEFVPGGYECEVELIVPSGLARDVDESIKSFTGEVGFIGKVRPQIIFYKQITAYGEPIQLIESESGQICKFDGAYINSLPNNTLLMLDCAKKKLYFQQYNEWFQIDPSAITLDSEFFVLNGKFNFDESKNCKVSEVKYYNLSG